MKPLMVVGLLVLVLGIASLFVPVPQRERHGIEAGGVSVGITTTHDEKVNPLGSGALVVVGVVLLGASRFGKSR